MTISWILLNLTAAAVLLIWAVRMVQTGVQRAHGPLIRRTLKSLKGHPLLMTVFGVLLADNMTAVSEVIMNKLLKLAKEQNEEALVFSNKGWREL